MKKIIAAALSLCIFGGALPVLSNYSPDTVMTASAEDNEYTYYEEDYLEYRVYSDHAELYQYSILSDNGNIVVPDEVMGVPVTSIASYAFQGSGPVNSIIISDNVTTISASAFSGCEYLASVKLPNGLTSIPDRAFDGCSSLTNIDIPDSVTKIGVEAFKSCKSLTDINIPSGVETISYGTFQYCLALESVCLPESVSWIDHDAFNSCTSLASINIPGSVTVINRETFRGCESLVSVKLPSGIKQISELAFYGCSALTRLTLPESVTCIAQSAFAYCSALEDITILAPECEIYDDASTISNRYSRTGESVNGASVYKYYFDGIIRGCSDSTAKAYAEKYGYTFAAIDGEPVCGDANSNGTIEMADAVLILQFQANPDKYGVDGTDEGHITAQGLINADCSGSEDGVTAKDALAIQKYLLKSITLPEE